MGRLEQIQGGRDQETSFAPYRDGGPLPERGRGHRFFLVLLLILLGLLLFYRPLLEGAGRFLIVADELSPSDALVVLGGGEGERTRHGLELYRKGLAPILICTGGKVSLPWAEETTVASLIKRVLLKEGVPEEVIILAPDTTSTWEDAQAVRRLALGRGLKSLIIVSTNYHMRRASWTFRRAFEGQGVRLLFSPAPGSRFDPKGWWRRESDLMALNSEYLKLLLYWFKHGL